MVEQVRGTAAKVQDRRTTTKKILDGGSDDMVRVRGRQRVLEWE